MKNRCGVPSASAVSNSDMSREVLCICINIYMGVYVVAYISLHITVALSFKCKSLVERLTYLFVLFYTDYFECQIHFGSRTYICMLCVFQFTLPPPTLDSVSTSFDVFKDSTTKVAFESYGSLLWPILFRQSSGNFIPRISQRFQRLESLIQAGTLSILEFIFKFITSLLPCSPDLIHFVWLGDTNHQRKSHIQWNTHWSCICRLQTFPADENRCGVPSASAVSSSDMSREVLCICINTYMGVYVVAYISLHITVALSFKCKSL